MKKVLSVFLVVAMIFTLCIPAYAEESQLQAEAKSRRIQDLASLAGKAARDGDYELAYSYEDEIRMLGGEILTYEQFVSAVDDLSRTPSCAKSIDPPPNTDYVHFTKVTTKGYKYGQKSFDIITITATAWADNAGYLHHNGAAYTNSANNFNLVGVAASKALASTSFSNFTETIMTMLDFFSAVGDSMSNYTTMSVKKGDGQCLYSIDMQVNYQWVSPYGKEDYRMMVREARYSEVNYSTSILASVTNKNGKVDTYTKSKDYSTDDTPSGYGSLDRVCRAYLDGRLVEYPPNSFIITIGTTQVSVPPMNVPPDMGII